MLLSLLSLCLCGLGGGPGVLGVPVEPARTHMEVGFWGRFALGTVLFMLERWFAFGQLTQLGHLVHHLPSCGLGFALG